MASTMIVSSSSGITTPRLSSISGNFRGKALRSRVQITSISSRRIGKIRMESTPQSAPGLGGIEVPLGGISSSAPLPQDPNVPVGKRIAYICQDCGYVYNLELPFQDQPEGYNCPVCSAPKSRFKQENANVEDVLDVTKNEN